MRCPYCGTEDMSTVKESRLIYNKRVRKRLCKYCHKQFFTEEYIIPYNDGLDLLSNYYRNNYCKTMYKWEGED